MKTPIFVHSLSEKERETLQARLRSKDAFTLRRSQMLLASSRREEAPQIAKNLGCGQQTVRDAIHDFNARGVEALMAKSSRPRRTRDAFDEESAEALRGLLHRSPTEFAGSSVVRITNISPFPGRSSDHALAISGLAYMTPSKAKSATQH